MSESNSRHDMLVKKAAAIVRLFSDSSVSQAQTKQELSELKEDIEYYLSGIIINQQEEGGER